LRITGLLAAGVISPVELWRLDGGPAGTQPVGGGPERPASEVPRPQRRRQVLDERPLECFVDRGWR